MNNLRGLGTALITPFTHEGAIDYPALDRVIRMQTEGETDYLVILGTTAETVTLSSEEQAQVIAHIIEQTRGTRLRLVLGLGGNCTAAVVQRLHEQATLLTEHFDAILSVCPYYNKPSQEGLFRHFSAIAEASPVPVILYNVPGRAGVNMLPETVLRLQQTYPDQIIGIKEASGNMDQIRHLIDIVPRDFLVISGDDALACDIMKAGGAGLISVASHAWPKEMGQIIRKQDSQLQQRLLPMISLLFREGNPVGIKAVLSHMGLIDNILRLPLVPSSEQLNNDIATEMQRL